MTRVIEFHTPITRVLLIISIEINPKSSFIPKSQITGIAQAGYNVGFAGHFVVNSAEP
jgi:hypothetical protein